jgi:hypothetical protein
VSFLLLVDAVLSPLKYLSLKDDRACVLFSMSVFSLSPPLSLITSS